MINLKAFSIFQLSNPFAEVVQSLTKYWTVQTQELYGFLSIASGQALEQTAYKDSITKGGLIGLTLTKRTVNQ